MQEQLVSFETTKLAKEKGFDIHCRFHFDDLDEKHPVYENEDFPYNSFDDSLFAPTQSLLQKWLREKHQLAVLPTLSSKNYGYTIVADKTFVEIITYDTDFDSYEEVLEIGLLTALKLI